VAKDQFSFDVVSEVDLHEVKNAFDLPPLAAPAWSNGSRRCEGGAKRYR